MSLKPCHIIFILLAGFPGMAFALPGDPDAARIPIVQGPVVNNAQIPAPPAAAPAQRQAPAAPASTQAAENPNVPYVFGSGSRAPFLPEPPHLPKFLPNGAVNLDEAWLEYGGARLYWNDIIIPQQLRMAGAYWIDPALVPQLFPDRATNPGRRYYPARKKRRIKSTAPVKASSTSLKTPAIPVPVTKEKAEEKPEKPAKTASQAARPRARAIPPLTASQAQRSTLAPPAQPPLEDVTVTPPPLQ